MSTFTYRPVPLTKRLHAQVYDSILPSNPSLSQAGNTVLITGGSDGIGFAIAKYFGLAKADKVIITGRTSEKLDIAVQKLTQDHMDTSDSCTTTIKFEGRVCQLSDSDSINNLFHGLSVQGIHVGVLVLNAAVNVAGTLSDQGYERTWEQFIVNTRALHQLYDLVHQQSTRKKKKSKYIVISEQKVLLTICATLVLHHQCVNGCDP